MPASVSLFASITPSFSARRLLPLLLSAGIAVGCSADDDVTQGDGALIRDNTPGSPGGPGGPNGPNDPGIIDTPITPGGPGPGGTSEPTIPGLGSETVCDGIDNDGNGIIDDVDVGNDGLCDCIRIGFFGQVASDAGQSTGSFESWLTALSGQVPIAHLDATATLTAGWLSNLQVLIVGGLQDRAARAGEGSAFTAEEIAAFDAWIAQGGGVITLSGYTANIRDARPVAELIQNTGLGYDLTSVSGPGVISEDGPPVWLRGITTPTHPIVDGVKEVGVYYGYPVTGDGTPILSAEGYVLGVAKEKDAGRVFAFADEWITQDATWLGLRNGQENPCQQPCNEQSNLCRIAEEQCKQCAAQPCSDPNETDLDTCKKGCQPSCESETTRCETYTTQCDTCKGEMLDRVEATPRLWLNTLRWLTPANECKVQIPPRGGVQIR